MHRKGSCCWLSVINAYNFPSFKDVSISTKHQIFNRYSSKVTITAGISVIEKRWVWLWERGGLEGIAGYRCTSGILGFMSV